MKQDYLNEKTGKNPFTWDEEKKKSNILFISMDMVPPEFYNPEYFPLDVRTPNLDSLKKECAVFSNAFSVSPLCAPSRASFLTGRYPYILANGERAHDGIQIHLRDDDTIYPEYLKKVGYNTRHIGKSHVGRRKFIEVFTENNSPWDRWSPPWYDDDEYHTFLRGKGLQPFSFARELRGSSVSGTEKGNTYGGYIREQKGKPFPLQAVYPAFLTQKALDTLEVLRVKDGPFYLQLDFFSPHQPFAIPGGFEKREQELRETVRVPDSFSKLVKNGFIPEEPEPRVFSLYRTYWGISSEEQMKEYMIANILQFEIMDWCIGRILDYLKKANLFEDTSIFFIADHGEMNGDYGQIDKGSYLQPNTLRVPLYIKPPSDNKFLIPGEVYSQAASLLDLSPTILTLAGIYSPERSDGISLASLVRQKDRPKEKYLAAEGGNHVVPHQAVSIHHTGSDGNNYLYVYNLIEEVDQLFLLSGRKTETANRIDDPGLENIRKEIVQRLWQILASDPRWVVYKETLRLENPEIVPENSGDGQLFTK